MNKGAVVLLSGGIDSSTTLAIAHSEGYEIFALSFDYAQRHKVEIDAARKIAEKFTVKRHLIINFDLRLMGGSALTDNIEVPKRRESIKEEIPVTYVPARNTIFLSFALAWAETLNVADIFIGANAIDYSGYPDCRPEYFKAFEEMANLATKVSIEGRLRFRIHTPLINMTKAEIIKKGISLGLDYSMTWSCYDPVIEKDHRGIKRYRPCLECDSCILREMGFREAGIIDPLTQKLMNSS